MSQLLFYLYLAAAVVIGCFSARRIRTPDDYYVAGRGTGTIYLAGSLLATILGSSAILGSIDWGYEKGWGGAWLLVCGAIGLFALLPLVKVVARFRGYNLSMLIGSFYGDTVKKLSGAVIAAAWLGVIGAQIIGAAKITSGTLGISYVQAACLVGGVLTFYTVAGGQFSIIRTDVLQTLLIFLGLTPVAVVLFLRSPSLEAAPMISPAFGVFDLIAMLFSYSSTFLVGPDIYSRLFCAKDPGTAKEAVVVTALLLIPFAFLLAFIGIYGARFYGEGSGAVLFTIARLEFPPAATLLLYFAMLSAIMSSADTTLFTAGGLLSQFFRSRMDSPESVRITKCCIASLGVLAILIAICFHSILTVLLFALGVYAGAFVVPVLWGLCGLRSDPRYAMSAILTGGLLALSGKLLGGMPGNVLFILAFFVNLGLLALGRITHREI
ncbi:MAG: sodium:solute symporter family protein [Lentisphaeria bacterium]|nr:sodium:solute symporter family protein [Lentisphaeria bacterium]